MGSSSIQASRTLARIQIGETQIRLDKDTVWSESLLSAWLNAQAGLSLLGLQAILLDWT